MEHFLLNSTACLFVLWLTYKLLLENTSWHRFKRYYLICAVLIALVIPFIVVETVVIPVPAMPEITFNEMPAMVTTTAMETAPDPFDWSIVIIAIYGIGVLIMLWRFIKNLRTFSIQVEDEITNYKQYQLILREVMTVPHSFLKRIFVSKKEYQKNLIPAAVLQHEKAHLDQKHSLDILFIEFLLILFWFNPLLYLIRYSIKLNHEFLADRAVINLGINTVEYQETLLHYTQQSHSAALANTFNFPIIKKRFQIMKTHTSQTSLLLRSLALVPVLALLIISCGKEETQLKEVEEIIEVVEGNQKQIIVDGSTPNGNITIQGESYLYNIKNNQVEIYDKFGTLQDFESQGYEVLTITEDVVEVIEDLTQKDIDEYNHLARTYQELIKNEKRVVFFDEDTRRMQLIYFSMNDKQRAQNEPWPYLLWGNDIKSGEIPPPPPPMSALEYIKAHKDELNYYLREDQIPADVAMKIIKDVGQNEVEISPDSKGVMSIKIKETEDNKGILPPPPPPAPLKKEGYMKVDEKIYFYTTKNSDHNFYDRKGNIIDIKGKTVVQVEEKDLPPPPPPAIKKVDSQDDKDTTTWVKGFDKSFSAKEKANEVSEWVKIEKIIKESTPKH